MNRRTGNYLKAFVGIAATVLLLWLALRGIVWSEVFQHLREANVWYLGGAIAVTTAGMHVRAMRWKPLLEPIAPGIPFFPRMSATAIGFAGNNLLPARIGEFARAYVMGRVANIPVSAAFASMVMERLLDGFICIAFLFGAMAMPGFPSLRGGEGGIDLGAVGLFVGAFAVVLAVLLVALTVAPERTVRVSERLAGAILPESFRRPFVDSLRAFLGGLGVLRDPRLLALSVGWVLFQWLFLATSFWLAFKAFGIEEPGYVGAIFLQSVINLAVSIPSGPGFFGPYEAAARYSLGLWGVEAERAISLAIGLHLGGYLTVTSLGLYYLARLNLRWSDLRKAEETVETAVEHDPSMKLPEERRARPRDG